MHVEPSARAKVPTSDTPAQLEAAAALGFVVAATANRSTMPTVLQLLALLPLQHRTAQEAFVIIGQAGPDARAYVEAKLCSELGAAVSVAFAVGYASHLAWKAGA